MKSDICDAHEAVKRAGYNQRAISVEVYGGDIVKVGVQCFGASTCIELSIQSTSISTTTFAHLLLHSIFLNRRHSLRIQVVCPQCCS